MTEVLEQGVLYLVQHRRRDDGLEQPVVEGGEQEVAGDDGDQDVGVEGGDADRRHP